jgi:uncharacterized protein YajQ (UPF0234 family)
VLNAELKNTINKIISEIKRLSDFYEIQTNIEEKEVERAVQLVIDARTDYENTISTMKKEIARNKDLQTELQGQITTLR